MHKPFIIIISIALGGILSMVTLSPLKMYEDYKWPMIKASTIIDAEPCEVFEYLGNSNNAKNWSVFVDHITLLNGRDGELGSIRRCFKDEAEQKEKWDEETVLSEFCKKRRLTVYDLKNFRIKAKGLLTEQLYERIEGSKCKLSFTLFLEAEQNYFWPLLKLHFFSFEIENIFQKNLNQIKQILEKEKSL